MTPSTHRICLISTSWVCIVNISSDFFISLFTETINCGRVTDCERHGCKGLTLISGQFNDVQWTLSIVEEYKCVIASHVSKVVEGRHNYKL